MILDKIAKLLEEVKGLNASTPEEIEALRLKYLSKKGEINTLMADFRNVPAEQKKEVGIKINELKQTALEHINSLREQCEAKDVSRDDIDLTNLPVLKCWPKDAGRFVTLPLVFTKPLNGGPQNLGMYRLQIYDKNTTGMHWHIHKDGAHYFHEYKSAKKRMPVAVAIGASAPVIYAATAPLPRGIDELLLAGFFAKEGVRTVKCKTVDLEVPFQK